MIIQLSLHSELVPLQIKGVSRVVDETLWLSLASHGISSAAEVLHSPVDDVLVKKDLPRCTARSTRARKGMSLFSSVFLELENHGV